MASLNYKVQYQYATTSTETTTPTPTPSTTAKTTVTARQRVTSRIQAHQHTHNKDDDIDKATSPTTTTAPASKDEQKRQKIQNPANLPTQRIDYYYYNNSNSKNNRNNNKRSNDKSPCLNNKNYKLISTALQAIAITLLTLTLSSCIVAAASTGSTSAASLHSSDSDDNDENAIGEASTNLLPYADFAALMLSIAAASVQTGNEATRTMLPVPPVPLSPQELTQQQQQRQLTAASPPPILLSPDSYNNASAFLAAILANSNISSSISTSTAAVTAAAAAAATTGSSIMLPLPAPSSTAIVLDGGSSIMNVNNNQLDDSGSTINVSMSPQSIMTSTEEGEFIMPPLHAIFVSLILLVVILGTVVGNVLVCIAVCMVRKLRRPCNYLLVSLALSDLCVAVLVMPMALLYEVLEAWNFGPVLCDIWVSFDVLCCTASILNLCAISVDRYLAITKPLEYGVKRTPRRMMLCVAIVWLAAACISLPPLLILGNEHVGENGEPICTVCQNSAYQIYATLGSFYIPLSVMLFVYYQIFRAARRIVLEEKRAQTHLQHALNGTGSPTALPGHTDLGVGTGSGNGQRHSSVGNTSLTYSTCGGLSVGGGHGHHGSGGGVSGTTGLLGSPHHKKLRFQLAKEKKASTTLGIIMSAFTICWLPFFILALIRPFVESETTHVPASLSSLFLWLGYANSLLNPIIYATLNRDFRKPFQEILYFRCSSLNTMMRENYYQDQYGEPPSQRVMLGDERHGARESFL